MYESVEHGGSLSTMEGVCRARREFCMSPTSILGDISAKTAASLEIMILTPELA